jgi:hypothetical protein
MRSKYRHDARDGQGRSKGIPCLRVLLSGWRRWTNRPGSERNVARAMYCQPGQQPGWTWCLNTATGQLMPKRKPGYTGPLPQAVQAVRQVWN